MRVTTCTLISGLVLFISTSASAQSAADIFKEMDQRKRASYGNVQNYTLKKQSFGFCTLEHFEKATTQSTDGRGAVDYMRLVPLSEIAARNSPESPLADATPAQLDAVAGQMRMHGPQMEAAMRSEMQQANLPGGIGQMLMTPPPGEPWLSPNPNDMMGMYATMLEGAADGKRQDAANDAQAAREAATSSLAEIAGRTRVAGRETLRNRPAYLLIAEDLNQTQVVDGAEFTLNTMRLWVDVNDYIPLKMSMEGIAKQGGESRDLKIEREDMEYRPVPGCPAMQEPYRTVMRIAGVMSPEEEAQMAEARVKLQEFESQLASMPEGQRNMIMRQMGPQLDMFRNMAAGNGIEIVSEVIGMRCNAGLPATEEYAAVAPGASARGCDSVGFGQ
jgi:hypothetical protein